MLDSYDVLSKAPLFDSLDKDIVERFISMGDIVSFNKGDIIFVEMVADDDNIYLVLEGEVEFSIKMMDCAYDVEPRIEGPGYPLGIQAFILPGPRLATATAHSSVTLMRWKASEWETLCEENPEIGYQFCRTIARGLFQRLSQEYFKNLNEVDWGLGG